MGGCRCTFQFCENSTSTAPGKHFFHFPLNDQARLKKWAQYSNNASFLKLLPNKLRNKVICEDHFRINYFTNSLKQRLIRCAVPTLLVSDKCIIDLESRDGNSSDIGVVGNTTNSEESLMSDKRIDLSSVTANDRKRNLSPSEEEEILQIEDDENIIIDLKMDNIETTELEIIKKPKPIFVPLPKMNETCEIEIIKKPKLSFGSPPTTLNNFPRTKEAPKRILNQLYKIPATEDRHNITIEPLRKEIVRQIVVPNTKKVKILNQSIIDVGKELKLFNKNPEGAVENEKQPPQSTPEISSIDLSEDLPRIDNVITKTKLPPLQLSSPTENITELITNACKSLETATASTITANLDKNQKEFNEIKDFLKIIETKQNQILQSTTNLTNKLSEQQNPDGAKSLTNKKPERKSMFNLNKTQLFNEVKKFLNPAMVALLRMELFGSSDREFKNDEKFVSVELLNLGDHAYNYFANEWRFRLPQRSEVEKWRDFAENDQQDNDDSD